MKRTCCKLEGGSQDHQELDGISPVPAECKLLDFTSQNVMLRAPIIVPATKLTNKPSLDAGPPGDFPGDPIDLTVALTPVTRSSVNTALRVEIYTTTIHSIDDIFMLLIV